jgi:predicted dehydrogenase
MTGNMLKTVCAGLGFVGWQAHVPSFRKADNSKLLGVVARKGRESEKKATKLKEKYGTNIYYDWSRVCRDSEIDAVCIATPTPFHYPMAKEALEGGKHVYLELPIATDTEAAEELGRLAEENAVILMPVLNFRKCPGYVKAKEILESGAIGDPVAITFREFIAAEELSEQWPSSSWAWDKERSGGFPDFTLSLWSLDMFRWFFNTEIENVCWAANYVPIKSIDDFKGYQTVGIIRFKNSVVGNVIYGSTVAKGQDTSQFEILGSNGKALVVEWNDTVTLYGKGDEREKWKLEPKGARVWGHRQLIDHFIQCCLGKEAPEFDYRDAIEAQRWAKKIVTDVI